MNFRARLKKTRKPILPRPMFVLEKLRGPDEACTFQTTMGVKIVLLTGLTDNDMDEDAIYNTAVNATVGEMLGKECRISTVSPDIFSTCTMKEDIFRRGGIGIQQKE